jgi:putative pyruvate formate lyase activating enzyme
MTKCNLCPRECGVNRDSGERGYCGAGSLPKVAAALPHKWEEPCISGVNGSGAVFFSGCTLSCVFCQNLEISADASRGRELNSASLRSVFEDLIARGAHNINLVTGTQYADTISDALREPLGVPVVWNSGGYESVRTLKMLDGKIDIYLPDFKYSDNALAERYSGATDYVERASDALAEMYRQTGNFELDENGILKKGVMVRHLILPGSIRNTTEVIDRVRELFPDGGVMFSLMSQYTPGGNYPDFAELNRQITKYEYSSAAEYLFNSGFEDGFTQDISSAKDGYIPEFEWD